MCIALMRGSCHRVSFHMPIWHGGFNELSGNKLSEQAQAVVSKAKINLSISNRFRHGNNLSKNSYQKGCSTGQGIILILSCSTGGLYL